MTRYRISNVAKEDLIRIHQFGIENFGMTQGDTYYESFFEHFDMIANRPYSYESVDFIKLGYRRCVCGSDSIYFRIKDGTIEIMTIIGRQDLNNIL